ncbi:hypothetical protein KSF_098480 [Reticulibacter mediterranei]|uniref:Uncharacterized protein n=1 Tax=Reticulibacter mediterranei TaxID=2778369 RepID=A0A8J3IWI1_9CHLR|nr:hypothetical protein [Reticulibacter mediterranei]GHO99800.1 hypothetical protein KSF_098480 [Reticulibacter mediterranei]
MDNFMHQPDDTSLTSEIRQQEIDALPAELQPIAHLYAMQPVPRPDAGAAQRLMERLLHEESAAEHANMSWRSSSLQILRVSRWQMLLLGPSFWVSSTLLLVATFLLLPVFGGEVLANLLIVLLPLTAILSVIRAVQKLSLRVHEIEASCPMNIVETTAALVLAIVFLNILLGLITTLALALTNWVPFVALLSTWLGPLLLLVSLSLPVALRWGTLPAFLIGGGPWLYLIVTSLVSQLMENGHVSLVNHNSTQFTLSWLSALLGLGLLLLWFLRGSNWQRHLLQHR